MCAYRIETDDISQLKKHPCSTWAPHSVEVRATFGITGLLRDANTELNRATDDLDQVAGAIRARPATS